MNGSRLRLMSLAVLFLAAAEVRAHNLIPKPAEPPTSPESAIAIQDPSVSRVFYSELDGTFPQTWLRFEGKAGDSVYLSVGVPLLDRLRAFSPEAALVGPGMPPVELGFALPDGLGALKIERLPAPREFHEGVTGTDSWILIERDLILPATGSYYFVAYPPAAPPEGAKLWMAIGRKERFGLGDLFSLGKIRRFVRAFHETK